MDTLKSSRERGATVPRSGRVWKKSLSALARLPMRRLLKFKIIENIQRADVHPFEEAQGFRALLDREGVDYTIEKIAAKTGKAASFIAKRLKLLDLTQPQPMLSPLDTSVWSTPY